VLALCLLAVDGLGQGSQLSAPVSYDAFMRLDIQERNRTFKQVTLETRAELVQTHIKRWLDQNWTRLTPEQLLVMLENLGFVTPDHYQQKASADDLARAKDLAVRTMALFSPKDLVQALVQRATHSTHRRARLLGRLRATLGCGTKARATAPDRTMRR
jgi:hypothetical protein